MRKLILIFFIVSCTASKEENVHQLSVETHDLAINIGKHVHEKIERINAFAQKSDDAMKAMLKDSVESLSNDLAHWESSIVEVPGHEHDHHDHEGHDHSHDHSPPSDLTPEMVLEVQRDLRDQVVRLNIRSQKILDALGIKYNNEFFEEKEKASSHGA